MNQLMEYMNDKENEIFVLRMDLILIYYLFQFLVYHLFHYSIQIFLAIHHFLHLLIQFDMIYDDYIVR